MANSLVGFPNLQTVTINDFTPGIIQPGPRGATAVFPPVAPLGSASFAARCYAVPQVGLYPFPMYQQYNLNGPQFFQSYVFTGGGTVVVADICSLGPTNVVGGPAQPYSDSVVVAVVYYDANLNQNGYDVWRYFNTSTSFRAYQATPVASSPNTWFPNLTLGAFFSGGVYKQAVVGIDQTTSGKWVTVPSWSSTADVLSGALNPTSMYKSFAANGRIGFVANTTTTSATHNLVDKLDQLYFTDIQAMSFVGGGNGPELFFPEIGSQIGTWGSFSTGEEFFIFTNGGAVLVSGDIAFPSSAIKFPGVVGTGTAVGPAALSPAGFVYGTSFDGAYVWNGGNTSQKISRQVPDANFVRASPTTQHFGAIADYSNTGSNCKCDAWNNWVMFPNNWVFDTVTGAWWYCEDPAVKVFGVHARSTFSPEFFYSSEGVYGGTGSFTAQINVYQWDSLTISTSWKWISNAITNPGMRVSLQAVEICASNPTSTAATITVAPAVAPGMTSAPLNQNTGQSQTFTIPAKSVGYRAAKPLGWSDYNLCVSVTATSGSSTAGAPTLHEITLGFDPSTSAVNN